jgi:S-(hydroxymethyl)glutathione synthase
MVSLHPLVDHGITKGKDNSFGGTIRCHCSSNPVDVELQSNVVFNHACGCSKCWKPDGALFSVVGVVPVDKLKVTANEDKIKVVDSRAIIKRNACTKCGVYMYGRIEVDHAFKGLDFVHAELSQKKGWAEPQFAGFGSSIIEQGFDPQEMDDVREKFYKVGLDTYDYLKPALMDRLATFAGKNSGALLA